MTTTRAPEPRAAGLARPLLPPVAAATTVERALAIATEERQEVLVVARRGRLIGGLLRSDLARAVAFDLGGLRLADLLVGDLFFVAPNASLKRVRETLRQGPVPFVVVRSREDDPSGYIDRRGLYRARSSGEEWSRPRGLSAARIRDRLRERISVTAYSTLVELGKRASGSGGRACLVGGVVRDLLLDRPTRDLDVLVEGDSRLLLRGLGRHTKDHSHFLTATLVLEDDSTIDVAHARSERYIRPAALPQVRPATIEEDLSRRDFTINTLALSLEPRRFASVLDLCGGLKDLGDRTLRVLHGLSFIDDPTRAFRAVRLSARLGFGIERRTVRGIEVALEQGIFDRLSSTRLRREAELLMETPEFPRSVRLADRHGLLATFGPGLTLSARDRPRLDRAATAVAWYRRLGRNEPFRPWLVPMGLLLTGAESSRTGEVLERLRPPRRDARILGRCPTAVAGLLARLEREPRPSPSETHAACVGLEVEILLVALACTTVREARRALRHHLAKQRGVRLEINGLDLLREGVPAGRAVARGLEAALAAKLDGRAKRASTQLRIALAAAGVTRGPA